MKLIKNRIILFWFLLVSLLFSQEKFPSRLKFEDILRGANSHPLIEVKQRNDSLIEIKNKITGEISSFYLGLDKLDTLLYPDLLIYIPTVDTMHYYNRFKHFKNLEDLELIYSLGFYNNYDQIIDLNSNGKKDIILLYIEMDKIKGIRIYEYNPIDTSFNLIFYNIWDDNNFFYPLNLIVDLDNDKLLELVGDNIERGINRGFKILKQHTKFDLPIKPFVCHFPFSKGVPLYTGTFFDLDNDDIMELIYYVKYLEGSDNDLSYSTIITKYNSLSQNYDIVKTLKHDFFMQEGYTIGDFDLNNKIDFLIKNSNGFIWIYEQQQTGSLDFSSKIIDTIPFYGYSLHNVSNDIDKNGYPEIWLSSFSLNEWCTYIYAYEAISENLYRRKYWFEIKGDIPLLARCLLPLDIDKDGNEEILFLTDYVFYIFKYTQEHGWILDYFKINDEWRQYRIFTNLIVGDIDFDGYEEIFIGTMNSPFDPITRPFKIITKIYKFNFTSASLEQNTINRDFLLYPNYPNPFNSQTTITFTIPIEENVEILINNILGEEVRTISLGLLNAGKHTINWDGKNNLNQDLPSGIYLINLKTSKYSKTIKSMLIR